MINVRRKKKIKGVCDVLVQAKDNRIEYANFVGVKGTKCRRVMKRAGKSEQKEKCDQNEDWNNK